MTCELFLCPCCWICIILYETISVFTADVDDRPRGTGRPSVHGELVAFSPALELLCQTVYLNVTFQCDCAWRLRPMTERTVRRMYAWKTGPASCDITSWIVIRLVKNKELAQLLIWKLKTKKKFFSLTMSSCWVFNKVQIILSASDCARWRRFDRERLVRWEEGIEEVCTRHGASRRRKVL